MSSILDDYAAFGVTVYMPSCSFQAEVSRKTIYETLDEMDDALAKMGVEDTPDARIIAIMNNAVQLSSSMATGPEAISQTGFDQGSLITELSFAFLYSYFKRQGKVDLNGLRGITCSLIDEALMFKAAETDDAYNAAKAHMRAAAAKLLALHGIRYDDHEEVPLKQPTIH